MSSQAINCASVDSHRPHSKQNSTKNTKYTDTQTKRVQCLVSIEVYRSTQKHCNDSFSCKARERFHHRNNIKHHNFTTIKTKHYVYLSSCGYLKALKTKWNVHLMKVTYSARKTFSIYYKFFKMFRFNS